ncbi:glycosyltransferase [Inmirania thermothiophila]|uniref:Glycosyltransferase involved in cell wall biosynthesis n=1 Tax=Inmirania thermothiophila TaxID=1750597 RepID=A0A3N1XZE6_9GAMM|nr:glycosyltransferase [Inmirania thermothiophila]ROR31965.1 glycosyltransferase involved in cell wall biosynthesis [Inmirania thermothiophila]
MKVLMVEASGRGFLAHHAQALAAGLAGAGARVRMATAAGDELAGWQAPFERRHCPGRDCWGWLRREVTTWRPEVVHLQWVDSAWQAWRFTRWAQRQGAAVLASPHNILPHRGRLRRLPAHLLWYRALDAVVARDAHLGWALEEIFGLPRERVVVDERTPNLMGLPGFPRRRPPELAPRAAGELRLLVFGHGAPSKGVGVLLEALAGLEAPGLHLVLAGQDPLRGVPAGRLGAARRRVRVSVIDRYLEPAEGAWLLRDADLLVLPYTKLCHSPQLALARDCALPVLRTHRVQGMDFAEGRDGVTVKAGEGAALREALAALAAQPGRLAAMRRALAEAAQAEAALAGLARMHLALYERLRQGAAARAAGRAAMQARRSIGAGAGGGT